MNATQSTTYPQVTDEGKTVWACCVSSIGPACEHRRYAAESQRYNGYSNRETWAVALHINNNQGWQESVLEALREYLKSDEGTDPDRTPEGLAISAGDIIRENVEEHLDFLFDVADDRASRDDLRNVLTDLGSLWRVNWTELGALFLADIQEADVSS